MSSVITNEIEYAKDILLKKNKVGKKEVFLLMKYFFYLYKKPSVVKNETLKVISENNSGEDNIQLVEFVAKNMNKARKYKIKDGEMKIGLSMKELKKISHLPHKLYRVLVYMLIISRYDKFKNTITKPNKRRSFSLFFNYEIKEAFDYCGYSSTRKEIREMTYFLCGESGYLMPSLSSSKRWQIMFAVDVQKRPDYIIDTSQDIIKQIPYFCIRCENQYNKISERHDMCEDCYKEVRKKKTVLKVRKHREKQKIV